MSRNPVDAELRRILDLPALSPSAPYELQHAAAMKADEWNERLLSGSTHRYYWWDMYPEGQAAAAIFRMWRALGMPLSWHVGGEPPDV